MMATSAVAGSHIQHFTGLYSLSIRRMARFRQTTSIPPDKNRFSKIITEGNFVKHSRYLLFLGFAPSR